MSKNEITTNTVNNQEIDNELLKRLEETCGASCYHSPDTCHCFGVMSDEELEDLGMDREDSNEDNAFYEMEHCPFYDRERYYVCKGKDDVRNLVREFLGDVFSESEIKEYSDNAVKIYEAGGDYTGGLVFIKATRNMSKDLKNNRADRAQYVYLLHTEHSVKIGRSFTPERRTSHLSTKVPFKVLKIDIYNVENMSKEEAFLHRKYKTNRLNGEWFNLNDTQLIEIDEYLKTKNPNA